MHHLIRLDLINIDILVITAVVPVFVELNIVIHALMTIPREAHVSIAFSDTHKASTYVSVSLIFAVSGSSPYAFRLLASSALYLSMTSPFSSW